jgi:hypothetical protein
MDHFVPGLYKPENVRAAEHLQKVPLGAGVKLGAYEISKNFHYE